MNETAGQRNSGRLLPYAYRSKTRPGNNSEARQGKLSSKHEPFHSHSTDWSTSTPAPAAASPCPCALSGVALGCRASSTEPSACCSGGLDASGIDNGGSAQTERAQTIEDPPAKAEEKERALVAVGGVTSECKRGRIARAPANARSRAPPFDN